MQPVKAKSDGIRIRAGTAAQLELDAKFRAMARVENVIILDPSPNKAWIAGAQVVDGDTDRPSGLARFRRQKKPGMLSLASRRPLGAELDGFRSRSFRQSFPADMREPAFGRRRAAIFPFGSENPFDNLAGFFRAARAKPFLADRLRINERPLGRNQSLFGAVSACLGG